jgi:hypothetical protein
MLLVLPIAAAEQGGVYQVLNNYTEYLDHVCGNTNRIFILLIAESQNSSTFWECFSVQMK